jgi:8-oxo-dGTP diphosphatase
LSEEQRKNMNTSESIPREYPQSPIATAHAVVFREDRALLIKRAREPGKGRWSVPGGMIELGETICKAAQRELREECGIEIELGKVVNVLDNIVTDEKDHIRFHYVVIHLLARYVSGDVHPDSDASEVRWATCEELDTLDMHPLARKMVQQAFKRYPDFSKTNAA